jgi:hypothetical protein
LVFILWLLFTFKFLKKQQKVFKNINFQIIAVLPEGLWHPRWRGCGLFLIVLCAVDYSLLSHCKDSTPLVNSLVRSERMVYFGTVNLHWRALPRCTQNHLGTSAYVSRIIFKALQNGKKLNKKKNLFSKSYLWPTSLLMSDRKTTVQKLQWN